MKLTTRARYGTRLMVDLARHYDQGTVSLWDVAKRQNVSQKYLQHLVLQLKNSGLIHSVRGAKGGYGLARKPGEISVGEIVGILEGGLDVAACVNDPELCERSAECPTRRIWMGMTDVLEKYLFSISLQDIVDGKELSYLSAQH